MRLPHTPRWLAVIGGVALTGGLAAAGVAIGTAVHNAPASTAVSNQYSEPAQHCSGCPADTHLDSVEVQARMGSTLFILRGGWPSSVDQLKVSVCLDANGSAITLRPHGSRNVFDPTVLTASSSSTTSQQAQAIAAGLQGEALLLDLQPPLQPQAPLTFDVALCNNGSTLERLPSSGELLWRGSGAPARQAAQPTPTFAPTPTPITGPDPTALINACSAIPSGTVPPFLQVSAGSSGVMKDPRTGAQVQEIGATLAASPVDVTQPFAIAAAVLPQGATAPQGQQLLADRAGTEQLYAFFDGQHLHKSLRVFQNGAWSTAVDAAANAMTIALNQSPNGAAFYWSGLHPGDHFGFITASSGGCAAFGLSASLAPQLVVGS